jgi:hypothetical protein
MGKKLILACAALVALAAFALPAVASAKPALCETEGSVCKTLATGVKIRAHNVGNTKLKSDPASGEPTVLSECTSASMTGELTKNSEGIIEGTITTATFEGEGEVFKGMKQCTKGLALTATTNGNNVDGENVENGTPWCVKGVAANDEFSLRGGACNEAARKITFILHTVTAGECKYERAEPVIGTYTTHTSTTEDAVLSVTSKEGTTADTTFKKEAGGVLCPATGTLEMSLTLETDVAGTSPLFIENNP